MSLKYNGAEILAMKYNGKPLLNAKINDAALWPAGPPILGNLFARMIALSTTVNAVKFKTAPVSDEIKYKVFPNSNPVVALGVLVDEYVVDASDALTPLPRGFEIKLVDGSQVRLRQYTGDATSLGGLNTPSTVSSWRDYATTGPGASHYIYIIDVTSRKWVRLQPQVRGGGSVGGSYINFFLSSNSLVGNLKSSFTTLSTDALRAAALRAWVGEIRADTTLREMVIVISTANLTPAF